MRCTLSGFAVEGRTAFTIAGPTEMFGANRPLMSM